MRATTTLSFPEELLRELKNSAKKAGISLSAYFQRMARREQELISEEALQKRIDESEKNYKNGEYETLKTREDIDNFFHEIEV